MGKRKRGSTTEHRIPKTSLHNLDSATDRRERRQQRRRLQLEAADTARRLGVSSGSGSGGFPVGAFGIEPSSGGGAITFIPTSGRGGAGSSAATAQSQPARGRSATPGRHPADSRSPSTSRATSRERNINDADVDANGERVEPESANIDYVRPPAVLRGVMSFTVTKPTRIKKIGVRLKGQTKTEWPEVRKWIISLPLSSSAVHGIIID